jgi:hypothetical protein
VADKRLQEGRPCATVGPPSRGKTMAIKIDDILMLFCVSGFFAGVAVAVTTLPV